MKSLLHILGAGVLLLSAAHAIAKDIPYESDVSVWVGKGGLKPGALPPEDVFITAVPGINLQRFSVPVDFCADDCNGGHRFLSLNCGMGNEYHVSSKGVAVTYLGASCNWPPNVGITVPPAKKYFARVRVDIPTDEVGTPAEIVPTAVTDVFTSTPKDLGNRNCTELEPVSHAKGGLQRLSIHTYTSNHIDSEKGLLANKEICVSVTPQGAGIERLTVNGGVYGNGAKTTHFLGSFQCEAGAGFHEGDEYRQLIESCGHAPIAPHLAQWSGPIEIRITTHISSEGSIGKWREVLVKSYPPVRPE